MHLSLSPNTKNLCAATDTSLRNIIIEVQTNNIVRDFLYGHKNDGFIFTAMYCMVKQ